MNGVDLALAAILGACAVRGWWRGFLRECFGLLALIVGVAAALRFAAAGEAVLQPSLRLPVPVSAGVAFVLIFVASNCLINGVGVLLSRLTRTAVLGTVNGVGGAFLGAGKGAVVLAFLLLFFHLFPLAPALDLHIMGSSLGRPLVGAASNAIRIGSQAGSASRA